MMSAQITGTAAVDKTFSFDLTNILGCMSHELQKLNPASKKSCCVRTINGDANEQAMQSHCDEENKGNPHWNIHEQLGMLAVVIVTVLS